MTSTMVITTLLFFVVARARFGWGLVPAGALAAGFLIVDFAFFGANIVKIRRAAGSRWGSPDWSSC